MSKREVFTAVCERNRGSRWWVVTVPELPGVVTQARSLADARRLATDAIALWLERSPASVDVVLHPRVAPSVDKAAAKATAARTVADAAHAEARERLREAVRVLVEDECLTVRDAAQILGISYQRVAQLAPRHRTLGARR